MKKFSINMNLCLIEADTKYQDLIKHFESEIELIRSEAFEESSDILLTTCICGDTLFNQFYKTRLLGHYMQVMFSKTDADGIYKGLTNIMHDDALPPCSGYFIYSDQTILRVTLIPLGHEY